jgi:hypothetical protein
MIRPIIPTTARTPTHTPALKIPPAIAQLLNVKRQKVRAVNENIFFIKCLFLKPGIKKIRSPQI